MRTRMFSKYIAEGNRIGDHALQLDLFTAYDDGALTTPAYESIDPADFTTPDNTSYFIDGYDPITIPSGLTEYPTGDPTGHWNLINPTGSAIYFFAANSGNRYVFTFNGSSPSTQDPILGYFISIHDWPETDDHYVLWHNFILPEFQPNTTGYPATEYGDHLDIELKMRF